MANIIPLPQLQRGPVAGAQMSVQAATAPARALGAFAEVFEQVGAFAEKVQETKDTADIVRARNAMRAAGTAQETWQATEPDESKWEEQNEERINQTRAVIGTLGLSPRAQKHVEIEMEDWSGRSRIEVRQKATLTTAANAHKVLQSDMLRSADEGNLVGVQTSISEQKRLGLLSDAEAVEVERKMVQRSDVMQANRALGDSPMEFLDVLEEKTEAGNWQHWRHLDENQRLQLKREARVQASVLRQETVQGFQQRLNDGERLTQEEMQTAVDNRLMTPQQMKYLSGAQRGSTDYADNVVRMASLSRQISAFNPGDPEAPITLHEIAANMAGLPASMRQRLETDLQNRAAGDMKSGATAEAEKFIDRMYAENFLGNIRTARANEDNPGELLDRDSYVRANERQVQLKAELQRWMQDHPTAGPDEQVNFIKAQLRKERTPRGATAVLNGITGRAQ